MGEFNKAERQIMAVIYFRTLRENVVEAIRNKIINQESKPGEYIVEMDIAEEFKTSRGPKREALRQLEHEFEIYRVRANYEILAVKYMSGKVPPKTIANMEKVLQKIMRRIKSG